MPATTAKKVKHVLKFVSLLNLQDYEICMLISEIIAKCHSFTYCHVQDILARLGQGEVIIGDGSYVVTLEKRGYVKAGDWTPEASVEVLYSVFLEFIQNTP